MAMWLAKAAVQKLLSTVPGGNQVNYALQGLSGSRRQDRVSARVPRLLGFMGAVNSQRAIAGARVLEIGTGWDAINAVLLSLFGAQEVLTVDHVRHLRLRELRKVLTAVRAHADTVARAAGRPKADVVRDVDALSAAASLDEALTAARIRYRAPADACHMPDQGGAFDIVYSYAVLAHFPEELLATLAAECRRIVRPGGVVAHRIGLQDPYNLLRKGSNVGFLAYSDNVWRLLDSSIQSNNRLRASQHVKKYTDLGGRVLVSKLHVDAADVERLSGMRVADRFAGLATDDLAAHAVDLVCQF